MALSTFFVLGLSQTTFAADEMPLLKTGRYETESQFCPQYIKWDGANIALQAIDDCDVSMVLLPVSAGVYEGKAVGYDYDYRLTVKDDQHYSFESINFETSGDFYYAGARRIKRSSANSQSMDPAQR